MAELRPWLSSTGAERRPTMRLIGDARCPGAIAHATYDGRLCAESIQDRAGEYQFAIEQASLL